MNRPTALSLKASHIGKRYHGADVLVDCSFSFESAGVYVLTGPNGCGKSTFLRICALIESPDSGEITFMSDGSPVEKDIALRRRITLVLPRIGIFNTTVFNNASYGLRVRGMNRRTIEEAAHNALEFVGLSHKKRQNALTLSSGEAQRLGIARALAVNPEILFLDEPTASVDRENTAAIENIIRAMKERQNTIVVITTHDARQARRIADYRMTMKEGRIKPSLD